MNRDENKATEVLDAIRLAVEGAANDRDAVIVIRALLADATAPRRKSTRSVALLLRAVKRTRRNRTWRRAGEDCA